MIRADAPISTWLNQTSTDPAGGPLSCHVVVLNLETTYTVQPRRRSVTITCLSVSSDVSGVAVNGVALAPGDTLAFESDYPGWQLPTFEVTVAEGNVVLVAETWVTSRADPPDYVPPVDPPPTGTYTGNLMLEDGTGALLLEDGSGALLLEDA